MICDRGAAQDILASRSWNATDFSEVVTPPTTVVLVTWRDLKYFLFEQIV